MRQLIIPVLLCLILTYSGCKKPDIGETEKCTFSYTDYNNAAHPKDIELQDLLSKYVKKGLPGIVVLVEDSAGKWIGSAGKASIEDNIDMEPCQVSKVASITKLLNYCLTYKLLENSQYDFSLDDMVSKWLPEDVVNRVENLDKVTIKMLMNHTSGIYEVITDAGFYLEVLNNPNKKWSFESLLQFVYDKPASFPPGDSVYYINTNTLLLAMTLEKITGKKHNELLKTMVLDPLGMNNTFYQGHDAIPSDAAQGYYDLYNNGTIVNVSNLITGSGYGYGGIFSTVEDLNMLIDALLVKKTLLSQESMDLMFSEFVGPDGINNYGIGIMQKFIDRGENFAYGHSGRDLGYSADAFYFPKKGFKMLFIVNYGTNANSSLRTVFYEFENELIDIMLQ